MHLIGRRKFFAGLGLGAGAYLLRPIHGRLMADAFGATASPKLLLYITGGGFGPGDKDTPGYWPTNAGGLDLGPSMTALAPYKSKAIFLERFYNPYNKHLHGNGYSTTTLVADTGAEEAAQPSGISFDRLVAKSIRGNTPILSLNLGTIEQDDSDPQTTFSADGPKALVPPLLNPVKAFETVFGKGGTTGGASDTDTAARLAQDKSVFDAVTRDIDKMSKSLAGAERAKLDQYLTSVRALEKQLSEVVKARASCSNPAAPAANIYAAGRRSPKEPIYKAMLSIAANALACGMTNVVTFLASEGGLEFLPLAAGAGVGLCGEHQMWHGKGTQADHLKYYNFQFGNVAQLRSTLEQLGGAALADETLILNFCQTGGQHHNGQDQYYALMLGNPGGRLKTGQYVQVPAGKRSMADVFLTAATALGVPGQTFGNAELKASLIPGVLA